MELAGTREVKNLVENNELVSIIVPIYNMEKFLRKCIESIVMQTYKNLEILLIDDGSTDSSVQICDEWKIRDNRVIVVHKSNGGLSDARNVGLDIAKGTFYAFIDSDDYITSDMIEIMLNSVKNNSCDIAVCNMIRVLENGISAPFYCPVDKETLLPGMERYQTLCQPSVCNKLFRAELFENIRFPKAKYYEDTFIYHELVYRANSIVLTGSNSYWYLSREDSIVGRPQYTILYFDFVEAVWYRAKFLLEHSVQSYGEEACLSLYAAVANAEKNIKKSAENRSNFKNMRSQYDLAYKALMRRGTDIGIKQRIRLVLLKYFPIFHSKMY